MAFRVLTVSILATLRLADGVQKNTEHIQAGAAAESDLNSTRMAAWVVQVARRQDPAASSGGLLGQGAGSIISSSLALAICYFTVYLMLTIVRSKNQYYYPTALPSTAEKVLDNAVTYCVYVAPMLCVMYFEVVQRFLLPPVWLQWVIVLCSVAFCLQAFSYIASEWSLLRSLDSQGEGRLAIVKAWRNVCNISTAMLYILAGVIMVAIFFLGYAKMQVGHYCTLVLAATYLGLSLVLFILRSHRSSNTTSIGIEIMKLATVSINFAPMLCILCMGTQMVMTWAGSDASGVVKWMYIATYAVVLQVLLVILAPLLADAELQVVGPNGEVDFVSEHNWVLAVFSFCRCLLMVAMIAGVGFMCQTLWVTSKDFALAVGLFYFTTLYFVTYFVLWFVIFTDGFLSRTIKILKVVKDTVHFCPMLSVLFLLAFAKAKQFGDASVPQNYCQDFMLIAVVALCVQVAMIVITGFLGKFHEMAQLCLVGFYIAMVALYLAVAVVAISTFFINAGNATVAGAWFAH